MWTNRIVDVFLTVLAWIVLPLQFVTTFVLGILVKISFGLLIIPFSLVWIVLFLGPLIAISWLWSKVPFLRIPLGLLGIPFAVLGDVYVCLIPSMGEFESRFNKLVLCQTFPYTLECMALISGKKSLDLEVSSNLEEIIVRLSCRDPKIYEYLRSRMASE